MSERKINNGKRLVVDWADFGGLVGFQDQLIPIQVSYFPNRGGATKKIGDGIELDGRRFRVAKAGRSSYVAGMMTLALEEVKPAGG